METKIYVNVAWIIFLIVAAVHLARIVLTVPVTVNGVSLPYSANAAGVIVAGFLAYEGFRLSRRAK